MEKQKKILRKNAFEVFTNFNFINKKNYYQNQ